MLSHSQIYFVNKPQIILLRQQLRIPQIAGTTAVNSCWPTSSEMLLSWLLWHRALFVFLILLRFVSGPEERPAPSFTQFPLLGEWIKPGASVPTAMQIPQKSSLTFSLSSTAPCPAVYLLSPSFVSQRQFKVSISRAKLMMSLVTLIYKPACCARQKK